jgi:Fur family ferric uptake transcriptional regulator
VKRPGPDTPDPHHPATAPDADGALRRAGLRRTPVRVGVLAVLARSPQPLGVPQVLRALPPDTDAVTVYRTLNTFTRKKLVHRVRGEDRTWRYALGGAPPAAASPHQHPHFVCDACGGVECLEQSEVPKTLVQSLRVDTRHAVTYAEVVLHGVCPKCHE